MHRKIIELETHKLSKTAKFQISLKIERTEMPMHNVAYFFIEYSMQNRLMQIVNVSKIEVVWIIWYRVANFTMNTDISYQFGTENIFGKLYENCVVVSMRRFILCRLRLHKNISLFISMCYSIFSKIEFITNEWFGIFFRQCDYVNYANEPKCFLLSLWNF